MSDTDEQAKSGEACLIGAGVDLSGVDVVKLSLQPRLVDYQAAMALADKQAGQRLGEYMLLSWYDRDRDFEAPQHSSECHQDSAIPGYVDYGLSHGASLMVDIEDGRFVFFTCRSSRQWPAFWHNVAINFSVNLT